MEVNRELLKAETWKKVNYLCEGLSNWIFKGLYASEVSYTVLSHLVWWVFDLTLSADKYIETTAPSTTWGLGSMCLAKMFFLPDSIRQIYKSSIRLAYNTTVIYSLETRLCIFEANFFHTSFMKKRPIRFNLYLIDFPSNWTFFFLFSGLKKLSNSP